MSSVAIHDACVWRRCASPCYQRRQWIDTLHFDGINLDRVCLRRWNSYFVREAPRVVLQLDSLSAGTTEADIR
jgi:hypothetical protein